MDKDWQREGINESIKKKYLGIKKKCKPFKKN